jgi:hypothetical protein
MKRLISLLLVLVPSFCFGMDRLSALSMLETGDEDTMVGKAGEISRYQIMKNEWNKVSKSTAYQDPVVAKQVTLKLLEDRIARFQKIYHRPPTDFEFYALWNAPGQAMRGKISPTVAARCKRFANLCGPEAPELTGVKSASKSVGSL